jgi:hypothetical protein
LSAAAAQHVFSSPGLRAIAVVVADGRMGHRGFGADVARLEAVIRAARQLLRDTTPAIEVVDFRFDQGRAIVGSVDDRTVILRTTSVDDAGAILRGAAGDARSIEDELGGPTSRAVEPAVVLARETTRGDVAAAMNLVLVEARRHLGGPVIRNYLKKARLPAPTLQAITIGLDGRVTDPSGDDAASEELVESAGDWLRGFLVQASVVAPELAALDVGAVTAEHDAALRPLGFYADHPVGQR